MRFHSWKKLWLIAPWYTGKKQLHPVAAACIVLKPCSCLSDKLQMVLIATVLIATAASAVHCYCTHLGWLCRVLKDCMQNVNTEDWHG